MTYGLALSQQAAEPQEVSALRASIPSADCFGYRFSIRDGRERHDWIASGELGAINIWAEPSAGGWRDEHWFGGIESHSAIYPGYDSGRHERCWLLGKECWHDGSSLQFSEQVEQRLPPPTGKPMNAAVLDELMPLLRSRYRLWLIEPAEERAASAIEARSDAAPKSDAAEGESAPEGDAQGSAQ